MFVRVMELDISVYIYIHIGWFFKLTTLQPCKSLQKAWCCKWTGLGEYVLVKESVCVLVPYVFTFALYV